MSDPTLLDSGVKLVQYNIVSIARGRERVLDSRQIIVGGRMTDENFTTWVIGLYVTSPPERGKPLPPGEAKSLRVSYQVSELWPSQPTHYEERQLLALGRIEAAIRDCCEHGSGPILGPGPSSGGTPYTASSKDDKTALDSKTDEDDTTAPDDDDDDDDGDGDADGASDAVNALHEQVLAALARESGVVYASVLAGNLSMDVEDVKDALRELEDAGLVERRGSRYRAVEA